LTAPSFLHAENGMPMDRCDFVRLVVALGICACGGSASNEPTALIFAGVPEIITFPVGGTRQLAVTVQDPAGRDSNIPISYTSVDRSVASVSIDGLITALKVGQTTITAHAFT
jgi:Big-like domain-containing protein